MTLHALLAVLLALAPLHTNSASRSELRVSPGRVEVVLRCQVASVAEVVALDADGNGLVEQSELDGARDELSRYLLAHYVVRVGDVGSAPLEGRVDEMTVVTHDADALFFSQFVDTRIVFDAPQRVDVLHVEMMLYLDTSPRHQDRSSVRWPTGDVEEAVLWGGRPTHAFAAPARTAPPSPVEALRDGLLRALSGWPHVALLLSLLVAAARLRTALVAVAVLLATHGTALVLGREGYFATDATLMAVLVPGVVALSGIASVLRRKVRPVLPDALLGGALLGTAEASRVGLLASVPVAEVESLVAWTGGFDVGMLALAAVALLVLRPLPRRAALGGARDMSLVPGYARDAVAMACALAGTYGVSRALIG